MTGLWAGWERWWFAPVDARSLAAMRISLGLMLTGSWLLLWPQMEPSMRLIDQEVIAGHHTPWRWSYLDLLSTPWAIHGAHLAGLLIFISFTVGYRTRWSNALAAVILISFWHRLPWVQNGGDRLLRIWTLTLLTVPSGAAWSVDAWLDPTQRRETVPALAHRLVQLQLAVVYTATGIDKLGGQTWLDGSAIYYAMSEGTFSRAPWFFDPLLQTAPGRAATMALTYVTLGWEVLFLPLVAWRRSRAATLAFGVVLHAGIFLTMSVGVFGPASVWAYQAFFAERWRRKLTPDARPALPEATTG